MYEDFHATDPLAGHEYHCMFQCLIVGIATSHSDTVDLKFLVNGAGVWVGLPHPAWVEFKLRTGQALTDRMAVDLAGLYLKHAIESGRGIDLGPEDPGDWADPLNPNPVTVHTERTLHWNDLTVDETLALCAEMGWLGDLAAGPAPPEAQAWRMKPAADETQAPAPPR